jgi:hypothetical protein
MAKIAGGRATQCVLDLAATLAVVISDTEAVYLYGMDVTPSIGGPTEVGVRRAGEPHRVRSRTRR